MSVPEPPFESDDELFTVVTDHLYSAVISDALDVLGHREHTIDGALRPLDPSRLLVGRVNPFVVEEVDEITDRPYEGFIAALDDLRPGEVAVLAAGGTGRTALWGELFSTAAASRGARGTIVDGPIRDQHGITALGYPVFARGASPLDCAGRAAITAYRTASSCGGLEIAPGELVVGDIDGLVVVPDELVEETVSRALDKVRDESNMRGALAAGRSLRVSYEEHQLL